MIKNTRDFAFKNAVNFIRGFVMIIENHYFFTIQI